MTQSPFLEMTANTPTVLWNDSADPHELAGAISWGAVGATCNPVIALTTLKSDPAHWADRIRAYLSRHPQETEDEIGWAMVKELSVAAAKMFIPAFEKYQGRNGRLSIQTDPRNWRNAQALADQAVEFSQLAPNVIVKIPVTAAGVVAAARRRAQPLASVNGTRPTVGSRASRAARTAASPRSPSGLRTETGR